jgi:uncharacterized protein YjbI with pentapeptide repeats
MLTNLLRLTTIAAFLALAICAINLSHTGQVINNTPLGLWLTTALTNLGPELAGIVIGIVTIDYLNAKRQENQFKKQLILQIGSRHNDVTDTALRTLQAYGWLHDGSLKGANIWGANLSGADLRRANLRGVNLYWADLREADLRKANLRQANLHNTDLRGAKLKGANLHGANLWRANLHQADLNSANLRTANLNEANLSEADLSDVTMAQVKKNFKHKIIPHSRLKTNLLDANLSKANLNGANLHNVENVTDLQLLQASSLDGAIMPDGRKFEDWIKNKQTRPDN